jgi:hypothetical protein
MVLLMDIKDFLNKDWSRAEMETSYYLYIHILLLMAPLSIIMLTMLKFRVKWAHKPL